MSTDGSDSSDDEIEGIFESNLGQVPARQAPTRRFNTFVPPSVPPAGNMMEVTMVPQNHECADESDRGSSSQPRSQSFVQQPSPLAVSQQSYDSNGRNGSAHHFELNIGSSTAAGATSHSSINEALKRVLAQADQPGLGDEEPEVLPHPDEAGSDDEEDMADEDDEMDQGDYEEKGQHPGSDPNSASSSSSAPASKPSKRQGRRAQSLLGSDMKRSRRDPAELEAETKRRAILEEERRVAALTFDEEALAPSDPHMREQTKYIPLRLTYDERKNLRLVNSAIAVSDYTNAVDIPHKNKARRHHIQLQQIVAFLTALVAGHSFCDGQAVLESRNFGDHEVALRSMLEAARRYKITNPEKMRSEYGKLIYLLQDTLDPNVQALLGVNITAPIQTVYSLCEQKNALAMLDDPKLTTATREILPNEQGQAYSELEIKKKERAVEELVRKYAKPVEYSSYDSSYSTRNYNSSWGHREWDRGGQRDRSTESDLTADEVRLCLYSISDSQSFLNTNLRPIKECLALLEKYFKRGGERAAGEAAGGEEEGKEDEDPDTSLAIDVGQGGARLSHSHEVQYNYVKQSLALWAAIVEDMFRLWYLAEQDLLSPEISYDLRHTGQGLQRVQSSPRVYRAMHEILARTKRALGTWVGSSVIHLGDHNVPNALTFIDKYTQVAQILGPLIATLKNIDLACKDDETGLSAYMEVYGGIEKAKIQILQDFFMHAFDGSGGNNDFDAGSCIDGRLTSAWNWCSQIANKPYYALFRLTGFLSFDGEFDK